MQISKQVTVAESEPMLVWSEPLLVAFLHLTT